MKFRQIFSHQTKTYVMATHMAVYFTSIFMTNFDTYLMMTIKSLYGYELLVWLRFIHDVFFIWEATQGISVGFLHFCDNFAADYGLKSNTKFKSCNSKTIVESLNTNVEFSEDRIAT